MTKRYEYFEHTADIGIRAAGVTLSDAFAVVAKAMFDIISDDSFVGSNRAVTIEAESIDTEGLLVDFLSKLIVVHEVENMLFSDFEIRMEKPDMLTAICRGEKFDPQRHRSGHHVKGVSYHMMEINESDDGSGCQIQILFDV